MNMAAEENSDLKCLKNSKISVLVEESLPDILMVTYEYGIRIFRGVLLDSTKKNLPFGIQSLNPALEPPKKLTPEDDPLYVVNQRFAYTDPKNAKKNVQFPSKYRNNKMTVRLRPRQVLCSKCKGVCSENSENVSRKRKSSETQSTPPVPIKRGLHAPVTRSTYNEQLSNSKKNANKGASLVPKLKRLTAEEEQKACNFIDTTTNKPLTVASNTLNQQKTSKTEKHSKTEHSTNLQLDENQSNVQVKTGLRSARRQIKRKRASETSENQVTSVENLGECAENEDLSNAQSSVSNTRTIKISYGPQGEGTVLKIPAKLEDISKEEPEKIIEDSPEETCRELQTREARKALKRAKKEARRKVLVPSSSNSPCYLGGATSPRCTIGSSSPRYTVGSASPRHGLGNNSPRYICTSLEVQMPRKRKHKMKHKKKHHRENKVRKHKEEEVTSSTTHDEDTKDQQSSSSSQKLSINLKRLQSRYTSSDTVEDEDCFSSDEQNESVPDFPIPAEPLVLRMNTQSTVSSAPGMDGARLLVGDVVWGKIQGFPWWPGKILTITNTNNRDSQAHVSWYGSSTSSLIQCDQLSPYLEHFKTRYNKKKRGPYKEAIRLATNEARENAESKVRQPLGDSPSHNNIMNQVVPPALASPREIDVAS